MRIIYWTELFWPHIGGVEIISKPLIHALQKRGHEFTVLTSQSGWGDVLEESADGIHIFHLPFQPVILSRDLAAVRELTNQITEIFQTFKPDLIHINSSQPSIFFLPLVRASCSIPTIFTLHESPVHAQSNNSLVGRTLHDADWVVAVSEATLLQARQLAPEITPRSSVIYNGLEMPCLPSTPLPFKPPLLLCIGRINQEKGFDLAIHALSDIQKVFPDIHLVIAGEGNEKLSLEQQAAALGLMDSIEFLGWCPPGNIPALINTATVLLVPSRCQEPFGLVALQAAQMARPVVAARTGGLPEVVIHNETGLLFEKESSSELAEQVIFLLQNMATAISIGQTAQKRAEQEFSLERVVAAYDTLYRKLGQAHSESEIGKKK